MVKQKMKKRTTIWTPPIFGWQYELRLKPPSPTHRGNRFYSYECDDFSITLCERKYFLNSWYVEINVHDVFKPAELGARYPNIQFFGEGSSITGAFDDLVLTLNGWPKAINKLALRVGRGLAHVAWRR